MQKHKTFHLFRSMTVMEQLKALKALTGSTLADLSATTGLSVSYLSAFLKGNKVIKIDAVEELAAMFGYKVILIPLTDLDQYLDDKTEQTKENDND